MTDREKKSIDRFNSTLKKVQGRNAHLMKDVSFREFLSITADEAGYLSPSQNLPEYDRGRADALRDIVTAFVRTSTDGAEWLAEYAKGKTVKAKETK